MQLHVCSCDRLGCPPEAEALLEGQRAHGDQAVPAAGDGEGQALAQARQRVAMLHVGRCVAERLALHIARHPDIVEQQLAGIAHHLPHVQLLSRGLTRLPTNPQSSSALQRAELRHLLHW